MAKTDNHNLPAKLDLRRYFLRRYHQQPFSVFDACQGNAKIWTKLRKEFPVSRYWGVDHIRKAGRLKIDSSRVLAQSGWTDDVIDVDTYGEPWTHWLGILKNMQSEATIFLTISKPKPMAGIASLSRLAMEAIGLSIKKVPPTLTANLSGLAADFLLSKALDKFNIIEAMEAQNPGGNVRYIGIRLSRKAVQPPRENNKRRVSRRQPGAATRE